MIKISCDCAFFKKPKYLTISTDSSTWAMLICKLTSTIFVSKVGRISFREEFYRRNKYVPGNCERFYGIADIDVKYRDNAPLVNIRPTVSSVARRK